MEPIAEGSVVNMSPSQNVGDYNSIVGDIVKNRKPAIEQTDTGLASAQQAVSGIIQQRKLNLNSTFASVSGTNPDEAAAAQNIGGQIGVGQDLAMQNMAAVKKAADQKRFESYDLMATNPVLGRMMADRQFASVAHDDIPQLSALSTLFKVFAASVPGHGHLFPMETAAEVYAGFTRGTNTYEYGNIYNEYLRTGNKELALKQKKEVDALSVGLPEAQGFIGSTSEFIGNMVMAQPEAAAYAAAYGVGGLAVGAATGPGALVTGAIGASAGYMTGMALTAFRVERGAMSLDMLEKGYDEDTVQIVGNIAGSINAALEMTGLKIFSAPARKFATKFIKEEILKRTTKEIEKVGLNKLIKETTLEYGKGVFAESATETMQDVVGKLADKVVSLAGTSNLQFNSDGTIQSANPEQSMREFAGQLVDTFIYTAKGAAVLGAFGAGMQIRHNLKQIATAKETTQLFTDLSKNVQATKLKGRSPSALANFVAAQAKGTAAETMYVDAEEMANVLNQSGLTAQQIDNALPGVREQLSKATSGGDIQIPTAQFAANIVGTKLEAPLMEHARLAPDAISAKQAIAQQETMQQNMKDAQVEMAVQEKTNAQFVKEAKEIETIIYDRAIAAGRTPTQAQFEAKLFQALAVTSAAKANMTPAQWIKMNPAPQMRSTVQAQQAAQRTPGQESLEQAAVPATAMPSVTTANPVSPIGMAVASANLNEVKSVEESDTFFKKVWKKLLIASGKQMRSKSDESVKEAAKLAVADIQDFVKNNPQFSDYYSQDWMKTRSLLDEYAGRAITDDEFQMYRVICGLTSPNTKLPSNISDTVKLWTHWMENGSFDGFLLGPKPVTGKSVVFESDEVVSGTTANTKIRTVKIIARLIKELGSVKAAINYLREPVTSAELNRVNKSLGYAGNVSNIGNIRALVKMATGQDKLIPRMFVFGQKVGAYTLNAVGDERFTTVDIWESRYIRSFFSGMFENEIGLPTDEKEHDTFVRFGYAFKDEMEKVTGRIWTPSSLQALRWFYIIAATRSAGYSKASTNETISTYTSRVLKKEFDYNQARKTNATRSTTTPPRKITPQKYERDISGDLDAQGITDPKQRQQITTGSWIQFARSNKIGDEVGFQFDTDRSGVPRGSGPLKGLATVATHTPGSQLAKAFAKAGASIQPYVELAQTDIGAKAFSDRVRAINANSKFGTAVYVYSDAEYMGKRLFISESGKSGFALSSDGDIVSVFSEAGSREGRGAMALATQMGGTKLDCFDTVLPGYYAAHGFRAVARIKWNDEYTPTGWDFDAFAQFNGGRPDVVYMVYEANHVDSYSNTDGVVVADPSEAVAIQTQDIKTEQDRLAANKARDAEVIKPSQTLFQSAVPATFYSALGVEVGKSTTKSASAEGWKQQIKGLIAKGIVKEKEVFWSGLDNWLDLQEGKITKEQVQAFLDAGGVKVETIILSDMSETQVSDKWVVTNIYTDEMTLFDTEEESKAHALEQAKTENKELDWRVIKYKGFWYVVSGYEGNNKKPFGEKYNTKDEAEKGLIKESEKNLQIILDNSYFVEKISEISDPELQEIANNLDETLNMQQDEGALFGDYQLPGGDNYREVIVTLANPSNTAGWTVKENAKETEFTGFEHSDIIDAGGFVRATIPTDDVAQYMMEKKNEDRNDKTQQYTSGHFPEIENPVVHVRLNDFVDTDGNKVMVVNEVQSDWGQEGREKGFVELDKEQISNLRESLRLEFKEAEQNYQDALDNLKVQSNRILAEIGFNNYEQILILKKPAKLKAQEKFQNAKTNDEEYMRAEENAHALGLITARAETKYQDTFRTQIPRAPFVESTGGWLELGLKQIMLEAVNGGYDKVAFVNGDQSVERYRTALTQKVDEVEITRNDDGTYTYSAIKDSAPIQGEQSVSANRINEVFGKEGSKQLLEQADAKPEEIHTIASSDIEIGGEGMRKFYDAIVPQALNKMLKKLGGDKIENVKIITESLVTQGQIDAAENRQDFTEAERLTAIYERQQLGRGVSEKGDQQIKEQQGFVVTPALAAQVSQGLPLFQAAQSGGARGEYDPIKNLINIGKDADYSTVAHELAHWYLASALRMAGEPTATEATKADADILMNWFGIAGATQEERIANWNAMSLDQQRQHHEAFAYNWELYLHTGKAPSVELQGVFDRFRRWLTRAYKSIRDNLNEIYRDQFGTDLPFLTDEVRGVFDRMLASEEQISRREAIDNFKGMYQTQEESGMSDAVWAAYQAEIAEAHEMAVTDLTKATVKQMEWLSGARKGILKTMQAAHNALRRSVQGEESDKMGNEPARKAERFFKTGKMVDPDGKEIEVLVGNKIDSVAVGSMYPTSTTGLAPAVDLTKLRGMTMEGGLSPDLAAEMFGFSSGDELIRALIELKPFKDELKERTDARMLDEHGDMNTEAEKEEAVNKALANEVRARIVAIENRYLTKVKTPVAVIQQGAKELARTILGRMAIKDIKPRNYVAAEARVAKDKHTAVKAMQSPETAGKSAYTRSFNEQIAAGVEESVAASEALVKSVEAIKRAQAKIDAHKKQYGDVDPAIVAMKASHQQIIQGQLAKEGYKILDEVEKQVSLFKRFFKDDKKIAATRNMDLVNAARSILAFYGLGKHDKLPSAYLEQLKEYNPSLFETISAMVNKAQVGTPDYKSLTFEEFQSMQETVDALWQLAKRENQVMIEGKMVSLGQATEKLEKRLDVIGVPTTIAGETQAVTSKDRAVRHINSMKAILRRVEHWADSTDGAGNVGGPFTKYIWRPISQALDAYRIDRNKYVKRYVELLKQVPLPAGKIAAPELNYTFGAGNGGIGIAELLGAIMHSGNISNLEKLLLGRKWAKVSEDGTMDTSRWDAFIERITNDGTLTKEHFDFIQAVWDLNEELKPMIQKAHRDIEGYYFKEVEATAFTNRFGTYRGGYVPAKTDPFIVRDAQRQAKMSELESDFRAAMPSTGAGFTKSRVKYNKALSLDIRLMAKHIDDVIRYSHVQPAVKDVLRILKKGSFADKLTQMDPMAIDEMLTPWLNRAARQITNESGRVKAFDTFWKTVRSRTGISVMIGNITNAMQQVTGLFMSSLKVKPAHLGNALYAYVASPNKSAQEVCELSPFMKNKMENQIFDLQDQMNELLLNPNKFEKIQKWSSHHGYFLQSAFQNMVDVVTWTGAYNQYLEESGVGVSDSEAQTEAVNRADAAVRLTQGTMNPEGIAAFEVGTPFYKTFIQFTGYFNMLSNLNADEYVKIFRDLGWRGNKGKLVYTFLMGFAAQAIISDAIVRTMRGGWEDDDNDGYLDVFMDWIFGSMARSAIAMLPFGSTAMTALSQIVMPVINGKAGTGYDDRIQSSPSISALTSSTVGVGRAVLDVTSKDKKVTGQDVKDVMTLISLTTGIPVTILGRPVSYLVDVNRGKVKPTSTVDFMRGLITGTATRESKKR